jgi:hypothetical protein
VNNSPLISDVVLIGAGGTGCLLAPPLARLIKYHKATQGALLHIVDADTFEENNATRQPVATRDIGQHKVNILRYILAEQDLACEVYPDFLDHEMATRFIVDAAETALFIATVDNHATRRDICIAAEKADDVAVVMPANCDDEDMPGGIYGQVWWWLKQYGATLTGANPRERYACVDTPLNVPRVGSCSANAPSSPQLIASNMLAAAWTLAVIQNMLDGKLPAACHSNSFDGRKLTAGVF